MLELNGTFIFVFMSFVIFVFLMNLICYKPLMKVIEKREEILKKNKKLQEETNSKKADTQTLIDREFQNAKLESSKILLDTLEKNKNEKEKIFSEKKAEELLKMEDFKTALNENSKEAKILLKAEIETNVKNLVSKILNVNSNDVLYDASKIDEVLK